MHFHPNKTHNNKNEREDKKTTERKKNILLKNVWIV